MRMPLMIGNFIFVYKLCSIGVTFCFVWGGGSLFCFKGEDVFLNQVFQGVIFALHESHAWMI